MKKANDFGPSVLECLMAEKAFLKEYQRLVPCNSPNIAIKCGLAAVWEAARKYQVQLEVQERTNKALAEVAA